MSHRHGCLIALGTVLLAALGLYALGRIYPFDASGEGAKPENYPRDFYPWSRGSSSQSW